VWCQCWQKTTYKSHMWKCTCYMKHSQTLYTQTHTCVHAHRHIHTDTDTHTYKHTHIIKTVIAYLRCCKYAQYNGRTVYTSRHNIWYFSTSSVRLCALVPSAVFTLESLSFSELVRVNSSLCSSDEIFHIVNRSLLNGNVCVHSSIRGKTHAKIRRSLEITGITGFWSLTWCVIHPR